MNAGLIENLAQRDVRIRRCCAGAAVSAYLFSFFFLCCLLGRVGCGEANPICDHASSNSST